jgi:hypothetical protein
MTTTTAAAALQAHVTVATIRTWCRRGVITATKRAGRWVIDTASLAHRIAIAAMRTRKAPTMATPELTIENMTAIGGSRWTKNSLDRVYLDGWTRLAGIITEHYRTGSIGYAEINGRPIANGRVGKLVSAIDKVYFDAADGELHFRHYRADQFEIRYLDGHRETLNLLAMVTAGVHAAVAAL